MPTDYAKMTDMQIGQAISERFGGEVPAFVAESLDAATSVVQSAAGSKLVSIDFVETADGWCCDLGWGSVADRGSSEGASCMARALCEALLMAEEGE